MGARMSPGQRKRAAGCALTLSRRDSAHPPPAPKRTWARRDALHAVTVVLRTPQKDTPGGGISLPWEVPVFLQ